MTNDESWRGWSLSNQKMPNYDEVWGWWWSITPPPPPHWMTNELNYDKDDKGRVWTVKAPSNSLCHMTCFRNPTNDTQLHSREHNKTTARFRSCRKAFLEIQQFLCCWQLSHTMLLTVQTIFPVFWSPIFGILPERFEFHIPPCVVEVEVDVFAGELLNHQRWLPWLLFPRAEWSSDWN